MEVNRVRMMSFLLGGLTGAALALSMQRSGKWAAVTGNLGKSLLGQLSDRKKIDRMMEEAIE